MRPSLRTEDRGEKAQASFDEAFRYFKVKTWRLAKFDVPFFRVLDGVCCRRRDPCGRA